MSMPMTMKTIMITSTTTTRITSTTTTTTTTITITITRMMTTRTAAASAPRDRERSRCHRSNGPLHKWMVSLAPARPVGHWQPRAHAGWHSRHSTVLRVPTATVPLQVALSGRRVPAHSAAVSVTGTPVRRTIFGRGGAGRGGARLHPRRPSDTTVDQPRPCDLHGGGSPAAEARYPAAA